MTWRLLNFDGNPRDYFALREVLVHEVEQKRSPSTITFYKPLETFVLLCGEGKLKEVNIEECQKRGIPIVRETAAGGVLLFTPSVLSIDAVLNIIDAPLTVEETYTVIMGAVIDVCEKYGVKANRSKHRPASNDVVINNRKVSGLAAKRQGNCIVTACAFTVEFDYDVASKVLKISASKFADKPYDTVRDWVTSLSRELGRDVPIDDVKKSFINALEDRYGRTLQEGELTVEEEVALESLAEKYSSYEWLKSGRWSPVKDYWRPK